MSDVPPPQDDRRLFENQEAKLAEHEEKARRAWDQMGRHLRHRLRRGEREPAF